MAEFTPNYNLEKPAGAEKYYISKFNANADKIDEALKGHDDTIAANKTQEEQDISDLRNELQDYADNAVSEHNLSEDDNLHPHIQNQIAKALADAKKYAYSKTETDERISVHNSDESAHQDIRNIINSMGTDVQTDIGNAIAVHNASPESHPDIRTDYVNYTDNAVSTHNNDPEAHGGKDVVYTKLAAMGDGFTSSMTHQDILTAFQDGKNVVALMNSGGEVQLETDGANITGKRTVIEGDKMVLETYVLDPETNMFTKTSTKYLLDYAPAIADEAIADVSIIVDPESDDEAAKIGSAIIGKSRVSGGTTMGGADWNAQEGEDGYIANKPFGVFYNDETVIWEVDDLQVLSSYFYYPLYDAPELQENIIYTMTIDDDSVEFTIPIDKRVVSKSKTFCVETESSRIHIIFMRDNPSESEYVNVSIKVTGISQITKKIDFKYTENSFAIDVSFNKMKVMTSAKDIISAIDNKMPIYIRDADDTSSYYPIDTYYTSMYECRVSFSDSYHEHYRIDINKNDNNSLLFYKATDGIQYKVERDSNNNLSIGWCVGYYDQGSIHVVKDIYFLGHINTIVYLNDIYTLVSASTNNNIYIYRNEKYGNKTNGVFPLTINELKIAVIRWSNEDESLPVVAGVDYTIEYTSTTYGIQTVPLVTFMNYNGSSVIGISPVIDGTPSPIPDVPTRTIVNCNVTNLGWSTEKNSSNTITLDNITDNLTVYAAYEVKMNGETINDSWSAIAASAKDGTYKTKYSVGDLKTVDLGSEGAHLMQLVAMDADDKADGSGKAPMTWIMKDLLRTNHRMNPVKVNGQEGTGVLGGYDKSEMKTYLNETILPLFTSDVRNNIVPVTKHQRAFDSSENQFQQTSTETLWIPGHKEIFNSTSYDTDGPAYSDVFKDDTSRKKFGRSSLSSWWLRSVYNSNGFALANYNGKISVSNVSTGQYVCPGFCM